MPEPVSPLMLEFLARVASRPRTYDEAMDAWRSTCPRHTVWEDALSDGLIQVARGGARHQSEVTLMARGQANLNGQTSQVTVPTSSGREA